MLVREHVGGLEPDTGCLQSPCLHADIPNVPHKARQAGT